MFQHKGSVFGGSREGKGFYIVLGLCALVVGTSSWILLRGAGTDVEEAENSEAVSAMMQIEPWESMEETAPAMAETALVPTPVPTPTAAPADTIPESFARPVDGAVSRAHSGQTLQYDATMGDWRSHAGIDIACEIGTPVTAAAAGTVAEVWEDPLLGVCLELDHGGGFSTVYANLQPEPAVSVNQTVREGDLVGHVGTSAMAEAAETSHLHFGINLYGESVNPEDYLR